MFLQSSTMGRVSRLVAFGLERRLTTLRASTLIISFSTFRFLAVIRSSRKAHSLARMQLVVLIFLEKLSTQEPFESLRRPPPLAQSEEGRTDASVLSLCQPRLGLTQKIGRSVL